MTPRRWFTSVGLTQLREFARSLGGFGRRGAKRAPNGLSKYLPHQGHRECLRRRLGGFAGVSAAVQRGEVQP